VKAGEGYIGVPGGKVWYRVVAPDAETGATPLLCLHGGPGFTHYYLEPLEALAEHRPVIFYDQLGCGRSDRPDDVTLWTVDRFVAELAQVRAALGLDRLHDERAERIHRHRHAEDLGHHGPPAGNPDPDAAGRRPV
jgi:proline-specific peptidase